MESVWRKSKSFHSRPKLSCQKYPERSRSSGVSRNRRRRMCARNPGTVGKPFAVPRIDHPTPKCPTVLLAGKIHHRSGDSSLAQYRTPNQRMRVTAARSRHRPSAKQLAQGSRERASGELPEYGTPPCHNWKLAARHPLSEDSSNLVHACPRIALLDADVDRLTREDASSLVGTNLLGRRKPW